ncbi:hypothetical protein LZC95_03605 [Pendulispora brunnea]|uniref:Porin n=1 Tax=Pendulispora brunnea TaxID=2905690 RepID=A0ABZ2KB74_9BACT
MDHLSYFGPGIGDTSLKPTFAFRRVRLSLAGQFLKRWDFRIEFETYVFPEVAVPTSPLAPRHTLHELMFRGQVYF